MIEYTKESLSAGIFKYVDYTSGLSPEQAVRIKLDRKDVVLLEDAVLSIVQTVLECRLNTLSGMLDEI